MSKPETAPPQTEYGFAIRHPYGTAALVLGFLLIIVGQDAAAAYGATNTRYPYTVAVPFLGLACFLGLGLWLAVVAGGDTDNPLADSFLPIYGLGLTIWLIITAVVELLVTNLLSVALAGIAAVVIAGHAFTAVTEFARPERVTTGSPRWSRVVIATNAVLLAVILGLYHGVIPISLTPVIVVVYLLATGTYPFALFLDAYAHAEKTGRTWRYPVFYGCLAIGAMMTIGVANWLITLVYVAHRATDEVKRND